MAIVEVDFVSRAVAESLLFYPDTAIVSITDPGKRCAALTVWFRQVLRLSFYDAVPGDEFIPVPVPGCFDRQMAGEVVSFVDALQQSTLPFRLITHCEEGVSRSAAIALFAAARSGASLPNRERAWRANPWVIDQLQLLAPEVDIEIPLPPSGTATIDLINGQP